MLRLLGGPPRCGKTTFTARAAGARGFGWLSTDVVRGVVNLHVPLLQSGNLGRPHGPEADLFFPAFEQLVGTCFALVEEYVIEGVGFFPRHVDRLGAHIDRRVVFVGQSTVDLDLVIAHAGRHAWHTELDDERLRRLPRWIEEWSAELERECIELGYPYIDLAVGDFAAQYDEVERLLF